MQRILFIAFILIGFIGNAQKQFYVSTQGNDRNSGESTSSALKTPEEARNKVRHFLKNNPNYNGDVLINISPGIYELEKTLTFEKSDGGINGNKIIWQKNPNQNGEVVFSGGEVINKWLTWKDDIKRAEIQNLFARQIYFRNKKTGEVKKAIRARSNDQTLQMKEYRNGYRITKSTEKIDLRDWKNIKDIEVISNLYWVSTRIPAFGVQNKKKLMMEPIFWGHAHIQWNVGHAPFNWLENALELVDKEYEWYIDRMSRPGHHLLYFHFGDNEIEDLEIIVPRLEKIISAKNVNNLVFKDIHFRFTTWNGPSTYIPKKEAINGFRTGLGDRYTEYSYTTHIYKNMAQIPGVLSFDSCSNIEISGCKISDIGSTGIEFINGSSHNLISNNEIYDISGSGISFHNWKTSDMIFNKGIKYTQSQKGENLTGRNNKISGNKIQNIANDYLSSCGVVIGYFQDTEITGNTITNFPYSGIAFISFTYGNIDELEQIIDYDKVLFFGTNTVSDNYIDCSEQVMPDGGGVYILGYHGYHLNGASEERTKIFDNLILNQKFYQGAIYLDKSSANIIVFNNIVDIKDSNPIKIMYDNGVYGIIYRHASNNISIYNNYYNSRYLPIPQSCPGDSCYDIYPDGNYAFDGFEGYKR